MKVAQSCEVKYMHKEMNEGPKTYGLVLSMTLWLGIKVGLRSLMETCFGE